MTIKKPLEVPVDGVAISPTSFSKMSINEIRAVKLWKGNKVTRLSQIFSTEGDSGHVTGEATIRIVGDASKIRNVGYKMKQGRLMVDGDAGMHLGEKMSGGDILVKGNAGSWLGSRMTGGAIEVAGDAGDYVGAPYRGSTKGMKGGSILIHGRIGSEAGSWMRGGTIVAGGESGMFTGVHMQGGTILVRGASQGRTGAQMSGGKIVLCDAVGSVLPSFKIEEIRENTKVGEDRITGPFYVFSGDHNENGRGRLFINAPKNPTLKLYEKYVSEPEE